MFFILLPQRLSELYYDIHRSYLKVAEVVNSEKRLFGRYYRVAFYGQVSDFKTSVSLGIIYTFPEIILELLLLRKISLQIVSAITISDWSFLGALQVPTFKQLNVSLESLVISNWQYRQAVKALVVFPHFYLVYLVGIDFIELLPFLHQFLTSKSTRHKIPLLQWV